MIDDVVKRSELSDLMERARSILNSMEENIERINALITEMKRILYAPEK